MLVFILIHLFFFNNLGVLFFWLELEQTRCGIERKQKQVANLCFETSIKKRSSRWFNRAPIQSPI